MEARDALEDNLSRENAGDGFDLADTDAVYSVNRMRDLLTQGQQVDKEFVLSEVTQVLNHCAKDFEITLLPTLCEQLLTWSPELQFKAAQALSYVVACPISASSGAAIVKSCVNLLEPGCMLKGDDRIFFYQVWSGILVESTKVKAIVLDQALVKRLLQLANQNAASPGKECRKAAARIYGALAMVCAPGLVESSVLPGIVKMYADPDIVVQGTAIESTFKLANKLPSAALERSVWPKMMKFVNSEDVRIKCTALRAIAAILEGFRRKGQNSAVPASLRDGTLIILRVEARRVKVEAKEDLRIVSDEMYMSLEVLTEVFGELLYAVRDALDSFLLKEAFKACVASASCNGPLLRRNIAYNFPGLCLSLAGRYGDVGAIFSLLAQDKDDEVRWNLSAGVHETLKILLKDPKTDRTILAQTISALVTDNNAAVVSNIMEHFRDIVQLLTDVGEREQINMLVEDITKLRVMADGSWRLQDLVVGQLRDNMQYLGTHTIANVVLPLMWRLAEDGMPPVRTTASRTIVHCLRYIQDKVLLNFSVKKYYEGLGGEDIPYRMRILLVDAGLEALKVFSSVFMREFFAKAVLALARDPISNVRLKLAMNLHTFSPTCGKLPEHKAAVAKLRADKNGDILAAMEDYIPFAASEDTLFSAKALLLRDQEKLKGEREFFGRKEEGPRHAPRQGGLNTPRANDRIDAIRLQHNAASFRAPKAEPLADKGDEESFIRSLRRASLSRHRSSSSDTRGGADTDGAASTADGDNTPRGAASNTSGGNWASHEVQSRKGIRRVFGRRT